MRVSNTQLVNELLSTSVTDIILNPNQAKDNVNTLEGIINQEKILFQKTQKWRLDHPVNEFTKSHSWHRASQKRAEGRYRGLARRINRFLNVPITKYPLINYDSHGGEFIFKLLGNGITFIGSAGLTYFVYSVINGDGKFDLFPYDPLHMVGIISAAAVGVGLFLNKFEKDRRKEDGLRINMVNRYKLESTIIDTYAKHLLRERGIFDADIYDSSPEFRGFIDGFIRGVEGYIARKKTKGYLNKGWKNTVYEKNIESLEKVRDNINDIFHDTKNSTTVPTKSELGYAVFRIYETKIKPKKLYRAVINSASNPFNTQKQWLDQ